MGGKSWNKGLRLSRFGWVGHCVKDDGSSGVDGEGVNGVAHGDSNQKVENLANGGG